MKKKDWFTPKRYVHLGLPLTFHDKDWVKVYVNDPVKVSQHSFLPFIHRELKVRKFRRQKQSDGSKSDNRIPNTKKREIFYASHLDAAVWSFYAQNLYYKYEKLLTEAGCEDAVTAYRTLPQEGNPESGKSNIHLANDVFKEIKNRFPEQLIIIAFDFSSFFDRLDHKKLKRAWQEVLTSPHGLPEDHYNLFKHITKFSYIREKELFNFCKSQIVVERKDIKYKKIAVKRKKYLKNKRAVAYSLKASEVRTLREKGLVKANQSVKQQDDYVTRDFGIPQGSPISAVLANIYMLEFDKRVNDFIKTEPISGTYKRYSDDIIIIAPFKHLQEILTFFRKEVDSNSLILNEGKTQMFLFEQESEKDAAYTSKPVIQDGTLSPSKSHFEYLGFEYDGRHVRIKSASIAKYYRKFKHTIRVRANAAIRSKHGKSTQLFKSKLYKRYTMRGAKRRRKYIRHPSDKSKFELVKYSDWGNFLTYVNLAQNTMVDNRIKHQLKNHWKIFHKELRKAEKRIITARRLPLA